MWRVQRLDQIIAFKPANLPDSKSLTLSFSCKQIGRFKTVFRPERRPERISRLTTLRFGRCKDHQPRASDAASKSEPTSGAKMQTRVHRKVSTSIRLLET